jgi:tRNA(Ile)-lysidine synthetase-like protein
MWLRAARGDLRKIGTVHLAAIEALIVEGQSGGRVDLPGDFVVSRQFEDLVLQRVSDLPEITPVPIPLVEGNEVVFGSYRLILLRRLHRKEAKEVMDRIGSGGELALLRECDQLGSLHLRTRIEGDTYEPEGAERSVKLKKLMIRHRIPLRTRGTHPLVVTADNKVLWAPGLPVSRDFIARGEGRCALIIARSASSADAGPDETPDATPDATGRSAKASIDPGG